MKSCENVPMDEGCFSFTGIQDKVPRARNDLTIPERRVADKVQLDAEFRNLLSF